MWCLKPKFYRRRNWTPSTFVKALTENNKCLEMTKKFIPKICIKVRYSVCIGKNDHYSNGHLKS